MKRFFIFVSTLLLFSTILSVSVLSDNSEIAHSVVTTENFFDWLTWDTFNTGHSLDENLGFMGYILGRPFELLAAMNNDNICSVSSSGYHSSSQYNSSLSHGQDEHGYYQMFQCDYCGGAFKAYGDQFKGLYDDYVSTLPFDGYTSEGGLIWYPTIDDFSHSQKIYIIAIILFRHFLIRVPIQVVELLTLLLI